MRIRQSPTFLLFATALVLSACGSSTPSPATSSPSGSARPADIAARGILAPSQCTRTVDTAAALVRLGVAPHELAAATLPPDQLGANAGGWAAGTAFRDGYQENEELVSNGFGGASGCDMLRSTGRVLGYNSGASNYDTGANANSSATVFLDEAGASAYLHLLPTLMKKGTAPNPDRPKDLVEKVTVVTPSGFGDDAVRYTVTVSSWKLVETAFRWGRWVGSVAFVVPDGTKPPVDMEKTAATAYTRLTLSHPKGLPLDVVALLSATIPLSDFGPRYSQLEPNLVFGGCATVSELAEYTSDPQYTAKAVTNGLLDSCRRMFDGGGVERVMSAVSTYRTAEGAKAARDDAIAYATRDGSSGPSPRTFEAPGLPGAIGLVSDISEDGQQFTDTRIFLPLRGQVIAVVFIHDVTGADRKVDAIHAATALSSRLNAVVAATA